MLISLLSVSHFTSGLLLNNLNVVRCERLRRSNLFETLKLLLQILCDKIKCLLIIFSSFRVADPTYDFKSVDKLCEWKTII